MNFPSAKELVLSAWEDVQSRGSFYESSISEKSVFQGKFKEILNYTSNLNNPRGRIIDSPYFNLGLAISRFMYLMTGKNTLAGMEFYAPKVKEYSDDGIHLFGSSYGYKIFKDEKFWKMIKELKESKNSKRLYFPIFDQDDFLRESKDIPCVLGFLIQPRESILNSTLLMRANDVQKLLPYNIFEFSLLQECLSVASDMELGDFGYYAGTLHLRGADIDLKNNPWNGAQTYEMSPVKNFNQELYKKLLGKETILRKSIPILEEEKYVTFMKEIVKDLDDFWKDIFLILTDYGYKKQGKNPPIINMGGPTYSLYTTNNHE